MILTREEIFQAVYALVPEIEWEQNGETRRIASYSRRIKLFSDINTAEQPWLGQAEHADKVQKDTNNPGIRIFEIKWIIYQDDGKDKRAVPAITNNLIIDAIEKVLEPKITDPGYNYRRNTLSGKVHHCYIDGEIFKDPGDLDDQGMIVVPIKILAP